MASLIPQFKLELKRRCLEEGFDNKIGSWHYRKGMDVNYHDLLGFGFSTYSTDRSVYVTIAIRHQPIEKLYQVLTNNTQAPFWLTSHNIGYLEPYGRYRCWYFSDSIEIPSVCEEIITEIKQYAYPFFREYEDIEKLIEVFEGRDKFTINYAQRFITLPLLYLYNGQKDKGLDFLASEKANGRIRLGEFEMCFYNKYISY